jgi:hypothetical protein
MWDKCVDHIIDSDPALTLSNLPGAAAILQFFN